MACRGYGRSSPALGPTSRRDRCAPLLRGGKTRRRGQRRPRHQPRASSPVPAPRCLCLRSRERFAGRCDAEACPPGGSRASSGRRNDAHLRGGRLPQGLHDRHGEAVPALAAAHPEPPEAVLRRGRKTPMGTRENPPSSQRACRLPAASRMEGKEFPEAFPFPKKYRLGDRTIAAPPPASRHPSAGAIPVPIYSPAPARCCREFLGNAPCLGRRKGFDNGATRH